ncbi:MAG: hypothetical protein AAB263_04935 [Planctomycetota bacterium]
MNFEALKKLSRFHWLIIIGAVTLLLAALFVFLANSALNELGQEENGSVPTFLLRAGDADARWTQITDLRKQIDEQEKVAKQLVEKRKRLESMQLDIEAARKRLPSAAEAQRAAMYQMLFGLSVQATSGTNAVTMKSFGIDFKGGGSSRGRSAGDIVKVEISTQVLADMDGLIRFLNLIERHERLMIVESIMLTNGGVAKNEETKRIEVKPHSVSLKIVTYIDNSITTDGPKK